jgi:type I restriction enzyme S subunit
MSEAAVIRLSDLVSEGSVLVNDGYRTKADELGRPGLPILRVAEVQDGHLAPTFGDHVRSEFRNKIGAKTSQRSDVVVTTKGTIGRVALVKDTDPVFVYSPQVCFVRVLNLRRVSPEFLYQWFRGPEFSEQALAFQSQTDMAPYINLADFRSLRITLPPLSEQRVIVDVLGALDDKIESNRRIWRTRLAISVAMYEGLRNRAESFSSLNDLYEPGLSGVWGEEVNTNGELLPTSCLRGRDIEDFIRGDRSAAPTRYVSVKQIESRRFAEGEIWTAGSGTLGPSILMGNEILSVWEYPVTYSNFVKRLVPSARHNRYAVCWHSLDEWRRRGDFRNFQTGTAMPNLDVGAMLMGVQVPDVSDEDARSLAETTLFALNPGLINENRRLGEIREALLPELLSGRLRVKGAQTMVENV